MALNREIQEIQKALCDFYKVPFCPSLNGKKMGVALNVRDGIMPINGLRHPQEGSSTGWYIWAGEELLDSPDFFKPLHTEHLYDWCPEIQKYLGLPPGWRFLFAKDYEDIWYDDSLLNIS